MARSNRPAVQKYHDRVAPRYDLSYDNEFWQWHDTLTWDYLKPFLPRNQRDEVVDLGCGTGKWAAKLIKSGYAVTCVDISGRMVEQARKNCETLDSSNRATFVQADLSDLSALGSKRYALAVAYGDPIGCTEHPARTMKSIRKILKDDGLLVATFDNRFAAIDFYLSSGNAGALSRFLRDGKTHWLTKDKDEQFPIVTFSPDEVVKLVERAGFEVVELLGKTVLPMRHHRGYLESASQRRTWAAIEKKLCRNPHAMGRASHIQVTCRVRGTSTSTSAKPMTK